MDIPFRVPCTECKVEVEAVMDLNNGDLEFQCPHGHHSNYMLGAGFTVGSLLLQRAAHEFASKSDFSMTIVMSAMAFECELSRLHHKWEQLAALSASTWVKDEALDELLRRYHTIVEKIEAVTKLMHPQGLDDFVGRSRELRDALTAHSPEVALGQLAAGFQQKLFWPRNRILHLGATNYSREDAAQCYRLAALGVAILSRMDEAKRIEVTESA
jgi:hypothetical protein